MRACVGANCGVLDSETPHKEMCYSHVQLANCVIVFNWDSEVVFIWYLQPPSAY